MSEVMMQPGDLLVYGKRSFWGFFIKLKTWSPASHVEVFVGNNKVVGSRDGKGVNQYNYDTKGLLAVLRPNHPFDLQKALEYFETVKGQKYDWWGLARFMRVGRGKKDKQFCSEFATNFYRAGGFFPFKLEYDADLVSPGMYLSCESFDWIWSKGELV